MVHHIVLIKVMLCPHIYKQKPFSAWQISCYDEFTYGLLDIAVQVLEVLKVLRRAVLVRFFLSYNYFYLNLKHPNVEK